MSVIRTMAGLRACVLSAMLLASVAACAGDAGAEAMHWSQFRGPNGSGTAPGFKPPVHIDADRPRWTTPLPPGKSSPVLWGGRIFLTGVEDGRLVTLALDAKSGEVLWRRSAPEVPLEPGHAMNSAAASTPCVDAERVYVYFGSYGLLCYDHEGVERWKRAIAPPKSMYGIATSPILHEQRLILCLDDDADLPDSALSRSRLITVNPKTGEDIWEVARPYNRGGWSTPMIWRHEAGVDLMVLGNGRVYGYDPGSGGEKWYVNGFAREPIAVPVAGDGRLYVSVSMQGGRGDVRLDPEPFWAATLHFDRDRDGRIGRNEITEYFTLPFRPELPPEHPGFGLPLPGDPVQRKARQNELFGWRDKDRDGFWTKEEFTADMSVGHGQPLLAAIRPGGSGDVTETHVSWSLRTGIPEIPSPVFHAGRLYMVRDGGILSCVDGASGEVKYRERLGAAGQYGASPVIAGEHVYVISSSGVLSVIRIGDVFQRVHQADLRASVAATPAMDPESLYVRTEASLVAFR